MTHGIAIDVTILGGNRMEEELCIICPCGYGQDPHRFTIGFSRLGATKCPNCDRQFYYRDDAVIVYEVSDD